MICDFYGWVFDRFGHRDNCAAYYRRRFHGYAKDNFARVYPDEMRQDAYDLIRAQSSDMADSWKRVFIKELREHIASCQEQAADIEKELNNS